MNKKNFILITFIFLAIGCSKLLCHQNLYYFDKNLFVGNIMFPNKVANVPQISVYNEGLKIQSEIDNNNKKIQFTISVNEKRKSFSVLITKHVLPKMENNTVTGLQIDTNQAYKLYKIRISSQNPCSWDIKEKEISENGLIPDYALIIIFNPDYIEKLEGGNDLELPKIIIKENILELAGSEKNLQNETTELLMSSLDLNILHTKPASEIKPDYKKKLIIAMSNN